MKPTPQPDKSNLILAALAIFSFVSLAIVQALVLLHQNG
jgi:hypothetical protein